MATKKAATVTAKFNKTQILDTIAGNTGLTRKQVASVLDGLGDVIESHVNKKAVGEFVLPGLLKISTVKKPAVKARKGISPFTKEEVTFKARPASTVVKVRPLKKLKEMVAYTAEFSSVSEACIRKRAPEALMASVFENGAA